MASPLPGQLSLSLYSYTAVEGSSITVNCTHAAGVAVSLSPLSSMVVPVTAVSLTYNVFTIVSISRLDNNKQFYCISGSMTSPAANITVWCKLTHFMCNRRCTSNDMFYILI